MLVRLILAVASGLSLWLAFPTHDLWWMAYVGVAGLALATVGAGPWRGALIGWVTGLAYFVPLLSWTGIFVGALPWLALAVLQSLYIAAIGLVLGFLQRDRVRPLVVALAWVVSELARSTTPFGGFGWGRLAFSQADAPALGAVSLLGTPGLTFVVALAGALAALGVQGLVSRTATVGILGRWQAPVALTGALVLLLGPLAVPRPTDGEPVQVLGIQGNVPEMTLEFNAQRRAVLDNHAQTTLAAAEQIDAGELAAPDLVLWPENSSDIDPLRNDDAAEVITEAVESIGAPLIVGGVLREPVDYVSNVSLLYLPGEGVVDRYVKQRPVPFAEYIPYRDFFRFFSDQVDLVATDFYPGSEPGTMPIPLPGGDELLLGIAICFEVIIDDLMRENVLLGAEVLFVPTNNATFGFTDESEQQLAVSRVKAVELGRSVVHVSTVGVSGLVLPDGQVMDKTELFTRDTVSGEVPRRTDLTLAARLGWWPERMAVAGLAVFLVWGAVRQRRS